MGFDVLLWMGAAYLAWLTLLYCLQDVMVFATALSPRPSNRGRPAEYEVVILDVGDEGVVEAWFTSAEGADANSPSPAVIYFHGNAGLIDFQVDIGRAYREMGWSVLLCEYRGHGRSGGVASEETLVEDAVRFYDVLVARDDVDGDRILIHGHSLGGAVAAQLSRQRRSVGLIVQATFRSVSVLARRFLAPGFLSKTRLDTESAIAAYKGSILLMHGRHDWVIPVSHGRRLAEMGRDVTYVEMGCGHNNLRKHDLVHYWQTIEEFLERVGGVED